MGIRGLEVPSEISADFSWIHLGVDFRTLSDISNINPLGVYYETSSGVSYGIPYTITPHVT